MAEGSRLRLPGPDFSESGRSTLGLFPPLRFGEVAGLLPRNTKPHGAQHDIFQRQIFRRNVRLLLKYIDPGSGDLADSKRPDQSRTVN